MFVWKQTESQTGWNGRIEKTGEIKGDLEALTVFNGILDTVTKTLWGLLIMRQRVR